MFSRNIYRAKYPFLTRLDDIPWEFDSEQIKFSGISPQKVDGSAVSQRQ